MTRKLTVALALSLGFSLTAGLAGCSGETAESTPEVVSLQPPSSASAQAASTPAAPVIRQDTTAAEQARMQQPWMKCLKEQGIPMTTTEAGLLDIDASGNTQQTNGRILAEEPKVSKICGKLRPVLTPELDEDKNPYWDDDNNNYHECLVEGGVPLVKKDGEWVPGPGWNDATWPESLELSCQSKAFDGKKG